MVEIIKETVVTQPTVNQVVDTPAVVVPVKVAATGSEQYEYIIYYFFGVLETLLSFRLILKMLGASVSSSFVSFIYGITGLLILPFEGIFRRGVAQGIETASILEPATIVALIVYMLLAWGIVKFIKISSGEKQQPE
jgi:hypothetical protein